MDTNIRPITVNLSSVNEIERHLKKCDQQFTPHLSSRVNIQEYSTKIFLKSERYECWSDDLLIAFVAVYFNSKNKVMFITMVSVLDTFRGQGIAKQLLKKAISEALRRGMITIELEVDSSNTVARRLYLEIGFIVSEKNSDLMILDLVLG